MSTFISTESNDPNLVDHFTEGTVAKSPAYQKGLVPDPVASFMRMIVLDVIPDPTGVTPALIKHWEDNLGVTNITYAELLPRNTIIAQRVKSAVVTVSFPMFLFPFFPSHLALPCKPGEMVWAMFENPHARIRNLGFWFCRISEPHLFDDVNHTHPAAKMNEDNIETLKKVADGEKYKYEMHNGMHVTDGEGISKIIKGTELISGPEIYGQNIFENLIKMPNSAKLTQYESVPRFKKRPGDVAIEGSNNSLIVLGTDRSGSIGDIDKYGFMKSLGNAIGNISGSNGSIDMVVGRGINPSTGGKAVETISVQSVAQKKIPLKKEIGKQPSNLVAPSEGDPDFKNDRSRILISQRTTVDKNFETQKYNSKFQIADSVSGDAAITIKTDKVRIIARSDISLIVKNFINKSAVPPDSGPDYKEDNEDDTKWASITIKTNGDIVFTPSRLGVIKLGGEDADKAILCTDYPAPPVTEASGGNIQDVVPIYTTGNSQVGTSDTGQGTFAKKVLVT